MKHTTINLVKFYALKARLKLPKYATVGVLETLWTFASYNARDGDISRFSALEIAAWLEWDRDPEDLIEALVETRWVDRTEDSLVLHDWLDNCAQWIKGVNSRQGAEPSRGPSRGPSKQLDPPPPNQTKPNITKANPKRSIEASSEMQKDKIRPDDQPVKITRQEFQEAKPDMKFLRETLLPGGRMSERDEELIQKSVLLLHYRFEAPEMVKELRSLVREAHPQNPVGYFKAVFRNKCEEWGCDLNQELAAVEVVQ